MKIELTDEQMNQALQEWWCEITHTNGFRIYCEIDSEGGFQYGEYYPPGKGRRDAFYVDADDIRRKTPRRPSDPSYYHNDPLCPSCGTYMIYHFEHCPKCGQKLDWSEKVGLV